MPSGVIALADQIVAALNQQTFTQRFVAVRDIAPDFDSIEDSALRVTVTPDQSKSSRQSFKSPNQDFQVWIYVSQKLPGRDKAKEDALVALVEEIDLYLWGLPVRQIVTKGSRNGDTGVDVCNAELLRQNHFFQSAILTTYQGQ